MQFITLNTIITDLLEIIRGANVSDSETISKRQVEDWVNQYRSVLLKQDLDKGKFPNPDYIQDIDYLKLELLDTGGGNNTSTILNTDNYILRTILQIPNTLDLNFKSGFTYIGTVDGNEIQFIPESRSKWRQYNKYTSHDAVCFLRDNYLYVMYNKVIEYISVRGIFEIPSEVERFVNPVTFQPYFSLDSRYPIPSNQVPVLKQMILKGELGIEQQSPSDTKNDSNNNQRPNVEMMPSNKE
jgi:hypothetical protein